MSDKPPKKLWSQQTVEERVCSVLRHQEAFVERIDPGDQALTHDNYKNNLPLYVLVDDHRHFMKVLQSILDNPAKETT